MQSVYKTAVLGLAVFGLFVLQQTVADTAKPYDESADAKADIAAALVRAHTENKLMLITFGANWCPDCRAFDTAIHQPELAPTIDERYVLVKVDVGNWDKNIDVVQRFDNPIAGGIPAIVVVDAQEHNLYATKAGQLAASRSMSASEFARFFEAMATLQYQPPGQ